ncbi:MAG: hypothetical protein KAG53_00620 [Endozoicomonadaceae bacterium]|nr:hypothetical protein [Endozoicomonadaceae bacterium]
MKKAVVRVVHPKQWIRFGWMVVGLFLVTILFSGQGVAKNLQNLSVPEVLITLQEHLDMPVNRSWQGVAQGFSRWARKPMQERWELDEIDLPPDQEALVHNDLQQLGFSQVIKPVRKTYAYGVILGATSPGMLERLNYLATLWRNGTRFDRLLFLTGQRPVDPLVDHFQSLMKSLQKKADIVHLVGDSAPMHETEAAQLLYLYADLPQSMRELPVIFIDTARTWQRQHWVRPNTRDTVKTWLLTNPEAGSVLMVSTQPHAAYQHAVVRGELSERFYLETVAPASPKEQPLAVMLDAVASWLMRFDPAQGLNPALFPWEISD